MTSLAPATCRGTRNWGGVSHVHPRHSDKADTHVFLPSPHPYNTTNSNTALTKTNTLASTHNSEAEKQNDFTKVTKTGRERLRPSALTSELHHLGQILCRTLPCPYAQLQTCLKLHQVPSACTGHTRLPGPSGAGHSQQPGPPRPRAHSAGQRQPSQCFIPPSLTR